VYLYDKVNEKGVVNLIGQFVTPYINPVTKVKTRDYIRMLAYDGKSTLDRRKRNADADAEEDEDRGKRAKKENIVPD